MPHSPTRWPLYSRPETSRLLKVDHYMLHVRIKMRLGGCVLSRQDADYTGGGIVGSFDSGSVRRGLDAQASMCVIRRVFSDEV
jgi:hypothetical protein